MFNVLRMGSLDENSGKSPGCWTHVNSTLTRNLVWPTLINFHTNFPPTLIRLHSVAPSVIERQDRDSCVGPPIHRRPPRFSPSACPTPIAHWSHLPLTRTQNWWNPRSQSVEFILFLLENTAPFVLFGFQILKFTSPSPIAAWFRLYGVLFTRPVKP